MLQASKDVLVTKICEKAKVSEDEVNKKIKDKMSELNGLVSEEGAAYIIASELGVNLLEGVGSKKLKIKDIAIGLRGVNISGRISRIFNIREFESKGKKGKVGAFLLGDDTGTIRVVIWNDQTAVLEKLEIGMAVGVTNGHCRSSQYSGQELHLGMRSKIDHLNEEKAKEIPQVEDLSTDAQQATTKFVGTIVQAYRPAFYNVCAECNSSMRDGECKTHGKSKQKSQMVLSFMLDDGETCIRCAAFREAAEKLAGMSPENAKKIIVDKNEAELQEQVENHLLGEVAEIDGRKRYNKSFERSEIMVNSCKIGLNPLELISTLTNDKQS